MAQQLGDRIRELRLEHPIYKSLRQFAGKLEKSPSWVSKVERNLEKPGAETLRAIARLLEADADELFQLAEQLEPDVEQNIAARYSEVSGLLRTLPSLTTEQIRYLEEQAKHMKRSNPDQKANDKSRSTDEILMSLSPVFLASRLEVTWMHDNDIEAAACALRHAFVAAQKADGIDIVCPPVCPETLVYEFLDGRDRLSLDLETPLGADENGYPIAGRMRVADDGDGGLIHIDCDVAATALYPFTLAHEIGHWILHRQHVLRARAQLSLFDTRPVQTQTLHRNLEGAKAKLPPEEWQANRFAVHLLLPADLVKKEFFSRYDQPIDHRDGEKSENLPSLFGQLRDCSRFVASRRSHKSAVQEFNSPLYEHFGVSRESMAIRLEELQLVSDNRGQKSAALFDA